MAPKQRVRRAMSRSIHIFQEFSCVGDNWKRVDYFIKRLSR